MSSVCSSRKGKEGLMIDGGDRDEDEEDEEGDG